MNKKIITIISLIILMTSAGSVFAAESLDTVQNTSDVQAENVSDKDNSVTQDTEHKKKWFNFFGKKSQKTEQAEDQTEETKEEKPALKHEEADALLDNTKGDEALNEEKETKHKRFFSKAEKNSEADEEKSSEAAQGPTTDVLVDSDTIEYFPERHEFEAVGNAKVSFPTEKSELYADKIIFNHDTNYIKGFGNVVLIKEGQKVNGDFIQVDLNEDNAMMTHPVVNHMAIKIRAKTGIVNDAQTEALDGIVTFNDKTQFKFTSRPIMGFDNPMMDEAIPKNFYFKEKYDNKWRLKAKTIVIDSYKDHDVATLKNADIYIQNTNSVLPAI